MQHPKRDANLFRHTAAQLQNRAVAGNRQVLSWGYLLRRVVSNG